MGMGYGHMMSSGFPWMMFLMLIFWVVLIVAGIFLVRNFVADKPRNHDALEMLKMRLIKGEISEEEYERIKDIIQKP